ncbi:MAG: LysR family transcriptional regulator substrate-binding protein [Actinobacteria bacterium]|nr:LysR family transcriptional regulator substrate-binding protein [Actinomycetota bacterium]
MAIASARDALEAVARGAADGAFVDGIVGPADPLALADPGLVTSMLVQIAPMAVMLPSDHPLASRSGLAWSAVADAQWLDAPAIAPTMAPGAAQLLHRRTNGTVYDGHDAETIVSLVARGHGLALVPQWWPTERAEVRCVVVREPPLVHRVELVVLRSRAEEWSQHLDPHAPPAHA